MKGIIALLILIPLGLWSGESERLPGFSYNPSALPPLQSEAIELKLPKEKLSPIKHYGITYSNAPKRIKKEPFIQGETDLKLVSPIVGPIPKLVYRSERFNKARFYGKFYASPKHFFYVGGIKPVWWRADPREVGVFAGSGIDF